MTGDRRQAFSESFVGSIDGPITRSGRTPALTRRGCFKVQLILLFAYICLFVCCQFLESELPLVVRINIACAALLLQMIWMVSSWGLLTDSLVNVYGLFLLMVALTHGVVPLLELLSIPQINSPVAANWINSIPGWAHFQGYFLIAISCSFLHLGASSARKNATVFERGGKKRAAIRLVAYVLLGLGVIAFAWYGKGALAARESLGYAGYFETKNISSWAINGALFVPVGAILLFVSSRHFDVHRTVSIVVTAIYAALFFYLGSRNRAFFAIASLLLANQVLGRRLHPFVFIACGVGVLLIAPLMSAARLLPRTMTWQDVLAISKGGITDLAALSLSELGVYSNIVITAVATFPDKLDFNLGYSYLNAIFYVFPNLFLPTGEQLGFDISTVMWLPNTYFPEFVQRGQGFGLGYSFIAEAYQSFGWVGSVVMVPVGYLVGYISNSTWTKNPLAVAFAAAVLPWILFYPRDSFYSLARGLVWFSLVPVLLVLSASELMSRKGFLELITSRRA